MTKRMSDEQLEKMGRHLATMHNLAGELWSLALEAMPINSANYRKICAAGRKTQDAYFALEFEAERREWPTERIHDVFSSRKLYGFN